MLWGNTSHCVESGGDDLSRYSNKIESVGLRKCPYYISDVTITNTLYFAMIWGNPYITAEKQLA